MSLLNRTGFRLVIALIVVIVTLGVVYLLGPRVDMDTTITFDPSRIGDDVEAYLAREEAAVPGIHDNLQKEIVWADPATKAKTPLAIVYMHGFSASKQEIRPVPDMVARALGANLFFTRFTGHGRDGAAMAEGSVNAWVNDAAEAMAVGRAIGDRVVVMATSTGGSIATWTAAQPDLSKDLAAMVLVSPNYGLQAAGASLLTGPWGKQLAELIVGPERSFQTINADHARYWTSRYPTRATLPVGAVAKMARKAPVEDIEVPALFVFSSKDQVVRPDITREVADRWGGPHQLLVLGDTGDPSNHVIAGDVLSPQTTSLVAGRAIEFLKGLK